MRKGKVIVDKSFFRVMIESVEPEQSFINILWVFAHHPGQAIETVLRTCARLGYENAFAVQVEISDFKSLPANVSHEGKFGVYYADTRHYFPTEKSFRTPFGIIKSFGDGEIDYSLIREGFSLTKSEDGIFEIETVVEWDKLFYTYIELIKRLPSIDVFWIKLSADWENAGREEYWINEELNTVELIETFLAAWSKDTMENGHVALTVYSSVSQTNLVLDTHKTISVLTKSARMQQRFAVGLRRLQFEELSETHSLQYGFYHWHFRPARSKSRKRLTTALKREGFSFWKERVVEEDVE